MCIARFASVIAVIASPLWGFEVEGQKTYSVAGATSTLRILSTADEDAFAPIIEAYQATKATVLLQLIPCQTGQNGGTKCLPSRRNPQFW